MKKVHKIGSIYADFLQKENDKNTEERYVGKESYYHASGSGLCSRKLYFQSVGKVAPTNPSRPAGMRVMRLGTIIHEDIQKSLLLSNTCNSNTINNNINNNINVNKYNLNIEIANFDIESEIIIEELNVRGFYDVVQIDNEGKDDMNVHLYDIKSAADYGFKKAFNSIGDERRSQFHELQLATYGYAVKEKYGRLDGMSLLYYNKNTSIMKYKEVPLSMLSSAFMFWVIINKQHEKGLPNFEDGVSPVMKWECDYCQFYSHCKPPMPYGRYINKHMIVEGV